MTGCIFLLMTCWYTVAFDGDRVPMHRGWQAGGSTGAYMGPLTGYSSHVSINNLTKEGRLIVTFDG